MNETKELTKLGIDDLIRRIAKMEIRPEEAMTTMSMAAWINGYIQCQNDVYAIIKEMRGETDC